MNDKCLLRQRYSALRAAAKCAEYDETIAKLVLETYAEAESFFVYVAVRSEVATDRLISRLLAAGKQVCVPRLEEKNMLAVPYGTLYPGAYGIPAPVGGTDMACDVTLTPLLAFDRSGTRLGYGGGYYDAYFARRPQTKRVGLAYSAQLADMLPCEPWDIPLQSVVTEKGIFVPALDTDHACRV